MILPLSVGLIPVTFAFQPLVTDDTGTQGTGGNQVELAVNLQRVHSFGDTTHYRTFPMVYTRGVTDALDVYASASRAHIRSTAPDADTSGNGNPVLGLKWRAWEDPARKLGVAVRPEVQFGVSRDAEARDLGTGRTGYGVTAILTQDTGFGAVHVNAAANRVRYALPENVDFHRKNLYRLSVAPVVDLDGGWKLAADVGVTTHPHRPERSAMGYVELGAIWSPGENLDVAVGYIAAVRDGEQQIGTLTAGVTWRFR